LERGGRDEMFDMPSQNHSRTHEPEMFVDRQESSVFRSAGVVPDGTGGIE
jgi:hypothetical protein